jgi:hypothetical protein
MTHALHLSHARRGPLAEVPVSDIVASLFLSPVEVGGFIRGAGPVVLPATSDPLLAAAGGAPVRPRSS